MEPARRRWPVLAAFAALAVLAGPVRSYTSSAFASAMELQTLAGGSLSAGLAGIALLLFGGMRRESKLRGEQWLALLVLLLPQWLGIPLTAPYVRAIPWLHETRWGVAFLMSVAAPLWLGLLASLERVSEAVPRAVVGAGIAGIGAVCLAIPGDSYNLAANQTPVLGMQLLLNVAMVFTWAYAAPRLAGAGTFVSAGTFLLLSALGDAGLGLVFERSAWQPVDRHQVWLPLLMEAAVVGCSWWLWFWLLQRMTLAAFSMRSLAAWVATLIPAFAFGGFLNWRIDGAVTIALAAIVIALRARVAEEQPMALGLNDT
jgi:hypothetical protein